MAAARFTFLVFGGSGRTGRHFTALALSEGHRVRALVRTPAKLESKHINLEVVEGSIDDLSTIDALLDGVDFVVGASRCAPARRENRDQRHRVAWRHPEIVTE